MDSTRLRLDLSDLEVEAFQPVDDSADGPQFYPDPSETGGKSTCIQHSCNACTFTCWAC